MLKEVKLGVFQLPEVIGGNDAWTTIRGLNRLLEFQRQQTAEMTRIIIRLCMEQGGVMRVPNVRLPNTGVRVRPDPNNPNLILIQLLEFSDGPNSSD